MWTPLRTPRAPASSRSSTARGTAARSSFPGTRGRCSIPPRARRSPPPPATTSSLAPARRRSAPTARPRAGADDTPGVAAIMAAAAYLVSPPEPARAPVRIAFTVDEEIGAGTKHLDLGVFGAEVAYTLDGSGSGGVEIETFNAQQ